jgi:peptidoglycan/xylan/chitin deacetylase (PgdA/CDA1 family)
MDIVHFMQRANNFGINFVTRKLPLKTARSHLSHPIASITFDDFPRSAWTAGHPILESFGARATYYTAGRFCGIVENGIEYFHADDLRAVRRAGHEIGAHSYAHPMSTKVRSRALLDDADRNDAALSEILGPEHLSSYAYPYGNISPRVKRLMARRFACARGIRPGVNAGTIDLAQLLAVPLEARRWRPHEIQAAVNAAVEQNGWIILFTHDVTENPSPYGCTPAMLVQALSMVAAAGIEWLPVKHAMACAVFGDEPATTQT